MTPLFQYELLNQPFGDPVLYVRLAGEKKALLFDLGEISFLKAGKLFKVTDVFVSHTHIDHFIGFDHLIRLNLARDRTLRIFGPAGIIRNVRGKLKGYTWNLVDEYPFIIEVVEISAKSSCTLPSLPRVNNIACNSSQLDISVNNAFTATTTRSVP